MAECLPQQAAFNDKTVLARFQHCTRHTRVSMHMYVPESILPKWTSEYNHYFNYVSFSLVITKINTGCSCSHVFSFGHCCDVLVLHLCVVFILSLALGVPKFTHAISDCFCFQIDILVTNSSVWQGVEKNKQNITQEHGWSLFKNKQLEIYPGNKSVAAACSLTTSSL